jgi:hypothetical protein
MDANEFDKCCICRVKLGEEPYYGRESKDYCLECYDQVFVDCANCEETIRKDETYETSKGKLICKKCFETEHVICDSCKNIVNTYEVYQVDESFYCESCFDDRYYYCERCDDYHQHNEKPRQQKCDKD